jgi:NAD(P)-dependent dehydrogenase (short-subunit alcohol dehydrogenase family)
MKAYGRSKLYNILFTRELARRLHGTGVTANRNGLYPAQLNEMNHFAEKFARKL